LDAAGLNATGLDAGVFTLARLLEVDANWIALVNSPGGCVGAGVGIGGGAAAGGGAVNGFTAGAVTDGSGAGDTAGGRTGICSVLEWSLRCVVAEGAGMAGGVGRTVGGRPGACNI